MNWFRLVRALWIKKCKRQLRIFSLDVSAKIKMSTLSINFVIQYTIKSKRNQTSKGCQLHRLVYCCISNGHICRRTFGYIRHSWKVLRLILQSMVMSWMMMTMMTPKIIKEILPDELPMLCKCVKCAKLNVCTCRINKIRCCQYCNSKTVKYVKLVKLSFRHCTQLVTFHAFRYVLTCYL